jgi:hypothetical protein
MTQEMRRSFLVMLAAVLLVRLLVAADAVFRPDGWNSFARESHPWQTVRICAVEALVLIAPVALITCVIVRLRTVRHKLANVGAILLAILVAPALFFVGFGEPRLRLHLHKSRYDAIVAAHAGDPLIVFDWGETRTLPLERKLEYLAFSRGDQAVMLLAFTTNDNPEPYKQGDAEEIRSAVASAWDVAGSNGSRSWKKLVLEV